LFFEKKNSILNVMAETTEWYDAKYEEIFDQEFRGLTRRFESNPGCPIADIQNQLHHLYVRDGNDQEGRGAVGDIVIAATIAAYERFIFEYRKNTPLHAD
jgi:hypothetical protein